MLTTRFFMPLLALGFIYLNPISAHTHQASYNVFKTWIRVQKVFEDRNFIELTNNLSEDIFLKKFKKNFEKTYTLLTKFDAFLPALTGNVVNDYGYQFEQTISPEMYETFYFLYSALESDPAAFIAFLKDNQFATAITNQTEGFDHYDVTINKYKALVNLLCTHPSRQVQEELGHALANRFFEYCFNAQTFSEYQQLLMNTELYPLARFLHGVLWNYLVGSGWKHWHKNTLDTLQERAAQGHKIVYIAGGNDIYQLLKRGIYTIDIIDPFLPSQNAYYAKNWQWFVVGQGKSNGIGDTISCDFDTKNIVLKRSTFEQGDTFYNKLANNTLVPLQKSITTWLVLDAQTLENLGTITIHRRFTKQEDFDIKPQQTLLMSYDEMIYAAMPEMLDGWGIEPSKFSNDFSLLVKQLRKPVSKEHMCNLRIASLSNFVDLKFINLASNPN